MAGEIRKATRVQRAAVESAVEHLRAALRDLKMADSPKAADKVRAAIRSCQGARRHVAHREFRTMVPEATGAGA